ncbi:MAG: hypothetical protein K1Y36_11075 [Blastocatellia bacterium]|nr:hypothetical protein [Blastocatellia bacterium]
MAEVFKIKQEFLPTRCEICHQADLLNPETGFCQRCEEIKFLIPAQGNTAPQPVEVDLNRHFRQLNQRIAYYQTIADPRFLPHLWLYYGLSGIPLVLLWLCDYLSFRGGTGGVMFFALAVNIGLLVLGSRLKDTESGHHQVKIEALLVMHAITGFLLVMINLMMLLDHR